MNLYIDKIIVVVALRDRSLERSDNGLSWIFLLFSYHKIPTFKWKSILNQFQVLIVRIVENH